MPEDDDYLGHLGKRTVPEWAENDTQTWKNAKFGWTVVLLAGAPIWQEPLWYVDWGSGIGGYVADFKPRFGDYDEELGGGARKVDSWDASAWRSGSPTSSTPFLTRRASSPTSTPRLTSCRRRRRCTRSTRSESTADPRLRAVITIRPPLRRRADHCRSRLTPGIGVAR